jgi:hypothetical protein
MKPINYILGFGSIFYFFGGGGKSVQYNPYLSLGEESLQANQL